MIPPDFGQVEAAQERAVRSRAGWMSRYSPAVKTPRSSSMRRVGG